MRAVSDDVAGQGGEPRERGHLHGVEQQGRHHRHDHAPHARPAARTLRRAAEDRQSAGQVEETGTLSFRGGGIFNKYLSIISRFRSSDGTFTISTQC